MRVREKTPPVSPSKIDGVVKKKVKRSQWNFYDAANGFFHLVAGMPPSFGGEPLLDGVVKNQKIAFDNDHSHEGFNDIDDKINANIFIYKYFRAL